MAAIVKRTAIGRHPVKLESEYWSTPGKPRQHQRYYAQVKAVVTIDQVALSMNGTAVFTWEEFNQFLTELRLAGLRDDAGS